ncbi:beta-ketoacyl synthase N-terminal-like domain-containing protein [Streptomyces sp. NPDC048192]|uniref:beta-ketoacyl synthase N-terminal-like domain-containing protein n=1 Tax=Streptomyces sp. NPDC048192 TaxID=3365510 RepID=UPI0037200D25
MSDGAIAVIGVGCRFPDAWNPRAYWTNIAEGRVSIRDLDPAALRAAGVAQESLDSPEYVARAAGIPGAADFAADFFGYSSAEAAATDPQQRIFLEVCWQALESAGHAPTAGRLVTGVFAGGSPSTYMAALQVSRAFSEGVTGAVDDIALHLGGLGDFLPSRVAYKLGLRGPSIGVQTACSSSLTAVHYAVLSLLAGECDMALAGGASVNEPLLGYRHHAGGLQSADGYCRPFDARSTGTSFSSGVGVVVLRRLADALRDGDPVLAVVHGTAVGNDGSARSGFTAPSPAGLANVVAAALDVAGVRADQLRYTEAHGSGTPLGDQIELRGLTAGLRTHGAASAGFCRLGSVKANIGHAGPAAGIAGLIKAVEVARTGVLPPHPLFERPRSPGVLAESPFRISAEAGDVPPDTAYVLVNSMGLGGTNATAVLGPPPAPNRPPAPKRETVRLLLTARTHDELDAVAQELAEALTQSDAPDLADAAHTLRVGRASLPCRRVVDVPGDDPWAAAAALQVPAPAALVAVLRKVLLVPPSDAPDLPVPAALTAALRGRTEILAPGRAVPDGRFAILLGHGKPAEDRHVLPLDPAGDTDRQAARVEDAVVAAWLHGAEVDFEALAGPRGRRVPLPAYPFTRTRHWALDTLPPLAAPPAPAAEPAPAPFTTDTAPPPGADPVETELLSVWRRLIGHAGLGLDDPFGALGGDSLTALRLEGAVHKAFGVDVDLYRAGGAEATVRRMAELVRGARTGTPGTRAESTGTRAGAADALGADLALDLGPLRPAGSRPAATDTLLTSATGFLDTFVLHELLRRGGGRVHCVVPCDDESEGRALLRERALACALPAPDPDRVSVLPAGPDGSRDWTVHHPRLAERIAGVVHTPAPFTLTGPYDAVREDTVVVLARVLRWMRRHGVDDLALISTLGACGSALGADARIEESRQQPLRPGMPGGAVAAWVGERLAERAEQDGMRVRVFRTGVLLGARSTGACDPDHPLWRLLAGALAVGVHPGDERPLAVSPVDLAARAIADLSHSPGSEGRAYHLVGEETVSAARLCDLLTEAGRPILPVPERRWQRQVALHALDRENEVLDPLAPRGLTRLVLGAPGVEAQAWRPWLHAGDHDPAPTSHTLLTSLEFAAARRAGYAELLGTAQGSR